MTLRAAIDQYIRWRQVRGARFLSAASTLRSYCRFVGTDLGCRTQSRISSDVLMSIYCGSSLKDRDRARVSSTHRKRSDG